MQHLKITFMFCLAALTANAGETKITIHANEKGRVIPKEIYGQFAEHLGTCIYGGLWVGPNSKIPNTNGYRNDVFGALKELKVPVLRWPGGCFADTYHWRDGIGPQSERPTLQNNTWGGTIEDNSFGTNEFLNLCEMLGCEPYISGNIGSGTVEELANWIEYMTSDGNTPMANLRRKNGRQHSWNVKYIGIGNEAWGCGGNMRPEYYSDLYRRYVTYCKDYDNHHLFKIASGASDYDYNWTKVLMNQVGNRADALSLHYYTVKGFDGSKGKSTVFTPEEYYLTLSKCLNIEDVIRRHSSIMDQKDPQKKIGLMVDEWGTWWDEEPGTVRGHLYQQNTMRDAMVAALTLNIFQRHTDRIKMANIAQVVNVLQSMILTDTIGQGHMVLTPTYYVFHMYRGFQNATWLPADVQTDSITAQGSTTGNKIPLVSVSAARQKDGRILVSLANTSLTEKQTTSVAIDGVAPKNIEGRMLKAPEMTAYNDFKHPKRIEEVDFKDYKIKKGVVNATLPPMSVVTLTIQ